MSKSASSPASNPNLNDAYNQALARIDHLETTLKSKEETIKTLLETIRLLTIGDRGQKTDAGQGLKHRNFSPSNPTVSKPYFLPVEPGGTVMNKEVTIPSTTAAEIYIDAIKAHSLSLVITRLTKELIGIESYPWIVGLADICEMLQERLNAIYQQFDMRAMMLSTEVRETVQRG